MVELLEPTRLPDCRPLTEELEILPSFLTTSTVGVVLRTFPDISVATRTVYISLEVGPSPSVISGILSQTKTF